MTELQGSNTHQIISKSKGNTLVSSFFMIHIDSKITNFSSCLFACFLKNLVHTTSKEREQLAETFPCTRLINELAEKSASQYIHIQPTLQRYKWITTAKAYVHSIQPLQKTWNVWLSKSMPQSSIKIVGVLHITMLHFQPL